MKLLKRSFGFTEVEQAEVRGGRKRTKGKEEKT